MDALEAKGRRTRRKHSPEFKAEVVEACNHTGVSVAAVARAHGLNANLLRRWLDTDQGGSTTEAPGFLPLAVAAPSMTSDISIEVRRGAATVHIRWPLSAAAECGSWLRTWLK